MALSAEDQALRSELSAARFAIERQLDVLRSSVSLRGGTGNRAIIARLQQQLVEIEEALAEMEDDRP